MTSRIATKNKDYIFDTVRQKGKITSNCIHYNDELNINFDNKHRYPILSEDSYGTKLRKLRKQKHLTAETLGNIIGVPGCNIRAIELGKHNPSHPVIRKLYSFFGDDVLFDDYSKYIINNYNENLIIYRKDHRLTGKQMAKLLGISEKSLFRLEKNSNITYSFYKRLEQILKKLGIIP